MKRIILTGTIALSALIFANVATAQNSKWTKGPSVECATTSQTITGTVTGLGSGTFYCRITGSYDCVTKGGSTPQAASWQALNVVVPLVTKGNGTGGNLKVSATLPSQCDHANWTFKTTDLKVTIEDGSGNVVIAAVTLSPGSCN